MTQRIGQGGVISLPGEYRTGAGGLVDPTLPQVDIIDPDDVQVVTNAVPVKDGVGLYHYDYTVGVAAPLGVWTAHWTGVINGVAVSGDDVFEVVGAGDIGFDPGALCSVEEVMALAQVTLTGPQQAAMTTLLADWTAELEERLNRSFTVHQITNAAHTATTAGIVWPRRSPVVSLTAIRDADGNVVSGVGLTAAGGIDVGTSGAGGTYYLDYTAGLSVEVAKPVRSILLARAARMAVKMADLAYGVSGLTQEGYSAPFLDEGWTEQELLNVDRRRKRVVRV